MAVKKTAFMRWIDAKLRANPRLSRDVDKLVREMKLEQQLPLKRLIK